MNRRYHWRPAPENDGSEELCTSTGLVVGGTIRVADDMWGWHASRNGVSIGTPEGAPRQDTSADAKREVEKWLGITESLDAAEETTP